jgi:hypothetical protein
MLFEYANYGEAALWGLVGLTFGAYAVRRAGATRRRRALAALTFLLFGLSDVVEVRTGAWWRPWWLLVWKAVCVLALVLLRAEYLRGRRKLMISDTGAGRPEERTDGAERV